MLEGLGDNMIWRCANCGDVIPGGMKVYRLPDGTVLCDAICVEDYAFMHNDDSTKEDSDVLAEIWDNVETFVISREDEI